jgi:hypothetical protein
MSKRLSTAAIGFALAFLSGSAQASPYFGFDGRHYGELQNAPDYGHKPVEHGKLDHADAPRQCLKSEIRALLEKVEDLFGPVEVISTCRPGATIAGSGRPSRHASGNAVDFEARGRKSAIIKWLAANHHTGGTMTYSDMSHIHIDFGPHFVALAAPSSGRTRTASRSTRGEGYASGYSRSYGGGSRRYAYEASSPMGGYSYGYGRGESGAQFRSGYATIYR